MMECSCCGTEFQKKNKGFKRTAIHSKFNGGPSAAESLEKKYSVTFTPEKHAFICNECSLTIKSLDVNKTNLDEVEEKFRKIRKPESYIGSKIQTTPTHRRNAKKAKVISTPRKLHQPKLMSRKSLTEEKVSLTVNNTPIGKAIQLLAHSRYRNGLRQLFKDSKSAKKAAVYVICDVVRQEICNFTKMVSKSGFNGGLSSILDFEWDKMMYYASKFCPSLLELVKASLTKKHYHNSAKKRIGRKVVSLVPVIGSLLCIISFIRTRQSTILQQLVSIIMWLGGCKRKVFGSFNRLGWCHGIDATRRRTDGLRQDFDSKVKLWRDKLSGKERENVDETLDELPELESVWGDEEEEDLMEEEEQADEEDEEEPEEEEEESSSAQESNELTSVEVPTEVTTESVMVPIPNTNQKLYFDITFDNINQKIGVRHHVRGKRNAMLNMVQGFATLERIGSYGMSNVFPSPEAIRNLKISDILPSSEDEMALKEELAVIVSRILTTYVPVYAGLDTVWSIPHQYSTQSAFRSEIVPLGILNKDESTTAGMIEILESYKEYIPENEDGDPLPLLLYCDGLSCERVEGAQRARINGADRWARLDLFEPAIQEWHRRVMFLQDTYDELFKFESHREKGTLYNLKQVYDHKGVTKNIMDCFDKAEALLEFATEGYIILYAMELSGMTEIDDTPKGFPNSPEERREYRDELSKRIVEKVYEKVNTKEVINVAAEPVIDGGDYCICRLEAGGRMVYCNNQYCQRGSWFHLECLGMEEDDVPEGEWFCSEECKREPELSLSPRKKMTADRLKDAKNEYVKRLIWRGLIM